MDDSRMTFPVIGLLQREPTFEELEENMKEAFRLIQEGQEIRERFAETILHFLDEADYEYVPEERCFRKRR